MAWYLLPKFRKYVSKKPRMWLDFLYTSLKLEHFRLPPQDLSFASLQGAPSCAKQTAVKTVKYKARRFMLFKGVKC